MALTHDDLMVLKAFFPAKDHEFDYAKNCYITEDAITERLEAVDPSWELEQRTIEHRAELGDEGKLIITISLAMTVKGVTRVGVGRGIVELRKDKKGEANQAEKTAATDALKRAARLFGIGRYLLSLPKDVKDTSSLSKWLNSQSKPAAAQPAARGSSGQGAQDSDNPTDDMLTEYTKHMYDHPKHQTASLELLRKNGVLTSDMKPFVAACHVLIHRAEVDLFMTPLDVNAALNTSLKDYLAQDGHNLITAWEQVIQFARVNKTKPKQQIS